MIIVVLMLLVETCSSSAKPPIVTSADLLKQGALAFSEPGVSRYSAVIYDRKKGHFIVGAKDRIYRLDGNLKKVEEVQLTLEDDEHRFCMYYNKKQDCYVSIDRFHITRDELYVFGVRAFSPFSEVRTLSKISEEPEILEGKYKAASNPYKKSTSIVVGERIFVGTTFGFDEADEETEEAIVASHLRDEEDEIKTMKHPDWLDYADEFFVAFEEEVAVYFVFREVAEEALTKSPDDDDDQELKTYSRVGRICKDDNGGSTNETEPYFVSFEKARLNCNNYSLIIAAAYSTTERILYTTFINNNFTQSAICLFKFQTIKNAFEGKFKYRKDENSPWKDVEATKGAKDPEMTCFGARAEFDVVHYHLMSSTIEPFCRRPHYEVDDEIFTVIGPSFRKGEVYISTDKGEVWNFTISNCKAVPNEIWVPYNTSIHAVYVGNSIVVLTDLGVFSIPFKREPTKQRAAKPPEAGRVASSEVTQKKEQIEEEKQSITQVKVKTRKAKKKRPHRKNKGASAVHPSVIAMSIAVFLRL